MNRKLYDLMDFPEIEAVVYSEEDHPREILGPRKTPHGILIQAFVPGEEKLCVRTEEDRKLHEMELIDEAGYFAVLLRGKEIPAYEYVLQKGDREVVWQDPYRFGPLLTEKDEKRIQAGNLPRAWEKLGAHAELQDGIAGVSFAVWAPNALRVSVVGPFNEWDGRAAQMNRLDCGVVELFLPHLVPGTEYQYELKLKTGLTYLKSDPYAGAFSLKGDPVSVIPEEPRYKWTDREWIKKRQEQPAQAEPLLICQLDFRGWCREHGCAENYRAAAERLADWLAADGWSHVEFSPLMEYPDDISEGYETCGYFAPTARFGTADDFCELIDVLHSRGVGVLMDFVASYFAGGNSLLAAFDGTYLYEHMDPRRGVHPAFGTHLFNYGRPEVSNFLISAAVFWAEKYHLDGFRFTDVATMLYQDYGRNEGEWVANLYGGNENLEAVAFLKKLNTVLHEQVPGVLTIAEEMAGWNGITAPVSRDGIGFDYKWNHCWAEDFLSYMHLDPLFRGAHQDDLTFGTVYAYSEQFLIGFGKDETARGKQGFASYLSGNEESVRAANLRLAMAYIFVHPGKKLLHADTVRELPAGYLAALDALYRERPALHRVDHSAEGFEWISNLDWEHSILVFLRKTENKEETLLAVCNFSNVPYEEFRVGVPYPGKYKEVFNSDAEQFGGSGVVNPRVKISRPVEHDERKDSIKVKVPPLGISVYQFSESVEKRLDNQSARSKKGLKSGGKQRRTGK